MSLMDQVISQASDVLDRVRADFAPGVRLFLLKRDGHTKRFTVIGDEITSGFWVSWNGFREQMTFKLADNSDGMADIIAQVSHVGHGVPNDDGEIDTYLISSDQRDRVAPGFGSPFWKLYGAREGGQRFVVPE